MVQTAADAFFAHTQRRSFAFRCAITGDVPQSRGLGSSVTVRLGTIHALNELCQRPLQRQEIFALCARLEGHPDNAAPAVYGGFNVVRDEQRQTFLVSKRLHFVLLIPNWEIATKEARRLLPTRVDRLHAVENLRNASAITAAFASHNYEKLGGAFVDHLHQPFRKKLIPFLNDVITAAESAGALGAFLSGSGSAICAITLRSPEKVAKAMLGTAKTTGASTIITSADNRGARTLPLSHSALTARPKGNPKSAVRNRSDGSPR
jgi:homoserine kinase